MNFIRRSHYQAGWVASNNYEAENAGNKYFNLTAKADNMTRFCTHRMVAIHDLSFLFVFSAHLITLCQDNF